MLLIGEHTVDQFKTTQASQLADRIFAAAPGLGSLDIVRRYVDEALAAGIRTDRDIAEFVLLMQPVDAAGRPAHIDELVRDPQTDGPLKLFQIYYALYGERP